MILTKAVDQARTRTSEAFRLIGSFPVRIRLGIRDYQANREAAKAVRFESLPTAQQRLEQMLEFYEQYESLVETLCDASQYGPDAKQEARYQQLRSWMQAHYPQMRKYVVAYLDYDAKDAAQGLEMRGKSADAYEALFAAASLDDFTRHDDGNMISRIVRTRHALELYAAHLRRLSA